MMNVGLPFRLLDILVNGYKGHYFCSNTLNKMSALIVSNLILKIRLYHFLIITNSCEIIIMEA